MTSVKFNADVLGPIASTMSGRHPLRRRASAAELARLDGMSLKYEVDNIIRLQLFAIFRIDSSLRLGSTQAMVIR